MNDEKAFFDRANLANFPLLAASVSGVVPKADKPGIRYLAASNGLWRAIDTQWLCAVAPLALISDAFVPYGEIKESIGFKCSPPPFELWREFAALAKASLPNEVAAAMVWNAVTGQWCLHKRPTKIANGGYVSYQEISLQEDEFLVVDIHSHGHHPAFFSGTDDKDDRGSIKVCAVLGRVGQADMQLVARLSLIDKTIPMKMTPSGEWETVSKEDTIEKINEMET